MMRFRTKTNKGKGKFVIAEENGVILRDLNTYIPKLISYLWDQPEIVMSIIKNADKSDLREHLAPFLAHNFYENILSSYYIEDDLMYVLTLLISDEINNLNDKNQHSIFLNDTPSGCLLEELKRKNDIQAFFKTILLDSIEDLEVNNSLRKIDFEISKNTENPQNPAQMKDMRYYNSYSKLNGSEDNFDTKKKKQQIQAEQEIFNQKYIPPLDKQSLEQIITKYKNNKKMNDYLNSKLNNCSNFNDYYSNKNLLETLFQKKNSQILLLSYQKNFMIVISFINSLLTSLSNNFHLLPYSVKCLCKIISILIKKKFRSINDTETNAFIAKFFFGKLLVPLLNEPGTEALINNFIISKNTIDNLKLIGKIINKFTSCEFFNSIVESDYTPFNWFFIEKMGVLNNIFDHITKVKLPSFIEKLITDSLPPDYEYNYFIENPDEVINYRSACFNLKQMLALLETMNKCKNQLFADAKTNPKKLGLLKTMEKLVSHNNKKIFDELIEKEDNNQQTEPQKNNKKKDNKEEQKKERPNVQYFLMTELITNKRYEKLLSIEQIVPHFCIKESKEATTEEAKTKNNIIKVKNFFCSLLYNYNKLIKTDFDEGTTGNTISILKELKKFMKSSNFVVDGTIPSEWYVNSLLEYLEKIPKILTKNDCEKLFEEIKIDVTKSIKELDFEALSVILEKLKYTQKGKKYYEDSKQLLRDIKINEKTKEIIENDFIPVEIRFDLYEDRLDDLTDEPEENKSNKSNKKEQIDIGKFEINPANFKEKERYNIDKRNDYEKSRKNCRLCLTIEEFTKKFPNIVKYQEMQDADIFLIQKILDFPKALKNYFDIIKDYIDKKNIFIVKGKDSIKEKIYDYVMTKLYDKIYPSEFHVNDNLVFQQSIRLSWTELDHYMKTKKTMVLGSFLSDVLASFKLIDSEKSPRKKLLNLKAINDSIGFLLKLNGTGLDAGVDDQLPILNFALVKSQQLRIYSNAKYMQLYIGDKKNRLEGSQLIQLLSSCEYIAKMEASGLNNVTKEEFIRKCNEATNNDTSNKTPTPTPTPTPKII